LPLLAIGEEFTFEDVNVSNVGNDETFGDGRSSHYGGMSRYSGSASVGGLGIVPSLSHSDRSQNAPGSPGGSVGGSSVVSRNSEGGRSVKSLRSYKSQDTKDLKDLKQQPVERLASC
jgi:hypothetical protein